VTSIGGSAFYNCTSLKEVHISDIESWLKISFGNYLANPLFCAHNLYIDGKLVTSIIIPDSVTSIGGSAFSGCLGLTSITIPDSVTSIGGSAFSGCSGFTSITIPDSVTSIGKSTFEGCMNLEEITLPFVGASASAIKEKSVFGYIFGYTTSYSSTAISGATYQYYDDLNDDYYFYDYYYHYYISTTLRKVTITSGTAIPENAFYGCTGLTSITIPDSVTSIGGSAFSDCSGLTSITIPDSVTSIGESAFYGCTNLTSITIPDSVTSIGGSAFSGCSGFTSITIPDSVTSIGKSTFEGCINLEEITLPFIGASASATGYKSVFGYIFGYTTTYSSSAISGATYQCREEPFIYYHYYIPTNLKKVTITGVTTIPKNAFYNCSMLISITIPDSVTSIGSSAFYNCTSLTMYGYSGSYAETYAKNNNITFMPITELIEKGTCGASLTWSYTPSTKLLTISGSGAMTDYFNWEPSPWNEYAGSIKTVIIENGVTTIGSKAFADCSGMISITIPDSVTSIGSSAFSYCNSLTNITIPEGVTCIDSYTFADCSSLVGITIPESVTSIGERAFALCSGLTNITIPKGVTSIGDFAFDGCNRLEIVTVNPDSKLTSIGLFAFCGCSNLTSITIPVSVTSIGLFPFRDSDNLTIYGYSGSYAETYANNNNIPFIAIIPVSVEGASLVLDGSIGVKMYLNVLGAELASNTVVEFLVYDNSEDDTLSEGALTPIYDSDTGLYYVTTYVAPKDVKNVEIIYIIICDDLIIEPDSIMISDYISDFKELAKTDEEFAKALGVVEALETYVEYAESFFGNGEALEDVTADTAAIEKIAGPEKSGSLSGIKHISTSLVLEGQTTIRHYFEVTGGTYTFKVGEEELEATELGDGIIYVDVADIPAHDLDKIYTLSVNDTLEINYSALNYVKSAISSEDQKLSNLVKALCNYWSATEEYVA